MIQKVETHVCYGANMSAFFGVCMGYEDDGYICVDDMCAIDKCINPTYPNLLISQGLILHIYMCILCRVGWCHRYS